ncbi:hypothetical protein M9Y10_034079 [Tritrichomonas musculus]|uniref:Uncharacterized protein n=1 Tax=Tritrichomonas musculus TaxID=1915356 RepID=A0ABR2KEK5_9EUKA
MKDTKSSDKSNENSKPSYQSAIEALQNQLKKSHQESMKYFMQRSEAISQLNAIANGAKLKASTGKNTQYTTLYETTTSYENAAYAIESALLTNNFSPADFSGVAMVNIPSQFKRAAEVKNQTESDAQNEESDDEPIFCGS